MPALLIADSICRDKAADRSRIEKSEKVRRRPVKPIILSISETIHEASMSDDGSLRSTGMVPGQCVGRRNLEGRDSSCSITSCAASSIAPDER